MIDWEEIAGAVGTDELKEAKLWLFQENIRLENERKKLAASQEKLDESQKEFLDEKARFNREMDELNRRTVQEQKRLREENLFFEKKLAILQDGFRKLDEDRKSLEKQKRKRQRDLIKIFHPDNLFGDAELVQMINKEYLRRKEEA